MRQAETVGPMEEAVGYVLKQAASALRAAMDDVLRPVGLTVPQYACLELLGQRPGLSNAELARGAFVSRQSMNGVLRGLQDRGLVTRPALAPFGRARPTELRDAGRALLTTASAAVRGVERRMLAPLDPARERRLLVDLRTCTEALTDLGRTADRSTHLDGPGEPPADVVQRRSPREAPGGDDRVAEGAVEGGVVREGQ